MGEAVSIKEKLRECGIAEEVRELLRRKPGMSRQGLAEEVCREWDLRDARGRLRTAGCLKALREMAEQGECALPAPARQKQRKWQPKRLGRAVEAAVGVPARADQIEQLELVLVRGADQERMRVWNELIASEHELGNCRAVGRQLRYLVKSEHGWLGAVGLGSAALRLRDRERWIGWKDGQRRRHLERIVNLTRLLVRRDFRCQNLASRILGRVARQVVVDYQKEYGLEPWLLESFVEAERYDGASFRAANWVRVGRSQGRGRNDRWHEKKSGPKDVYLYVLKKDFREALGVALPERRSLQMREPGEGMAASDWAQRELAGAQLGDRRRVERLTRIVEQQAERPGQSYAQAAGGIEADIKAYYRLIDCRNEEELNFESILAPHRERTEQRMMSQPRVLVIQDTTELDFGGLNQTKGLGRIGTNQTRNGTLGLSLHSALVINEEGVPLGVLKAECTGAEQLTARRQGRHRNGLPLEEKKSGRWLRLYQETLTTAQRMPEVEVISVMDREADIYELFQLAVDEGNRVPLLVRVQHDRCLQNQDQRLVAHLRAQPAHFQMSVQIGRQRARNRKGKGGRKREDSSPALPARQAQLCVSFCPVAILAPKTALKKRLQPVRLYAIHAWEPDPPPGAKKIEWMLLTTWPVTTPEQAAQGVRLYSRRWRIEDFHRVLKNGCKTENHQMETAGNLRRVIAIDILIAWRIMLLTLLGRALPDLPGELYFSRWEWQALCLAVKHQIPDQQPSLGECIRMVAKLGGHMGRKQDGPPGMQTIREGMLALAHMALMLEYMHKSPLGPAPT
jgi:hypothetical protein